MIWDHIDVDSSKKARRAVYIAGFSTLGLAAVTFGANTISIFGLEIVVEKERMVEAGRLATFVLCIVFTFREADNYFRTVSVLSERRMQRRHKRELLELGESWGYGTPDPPEDGPEGEFKDLKELHTDQRSRSEAKYENIRFWHSILFYFVLDFGFPVALTLIVLIDPYTLSNHLDGITVLAEPN